MQITSIITFDGFLAHAINGVRLSYQSNNRSDSYFFTPTELDIGPNDRKLLQALLNAGDGEDKFMRTIPVSMMITASMRWFQQLDTYNVGVTMQSSSLMHRVAARGGFTCDDFVMADGGAGDLISIDIERLNILYNDWICAGGQRNDSSCEWSRLLDAIPQSVKYTRQWYANYAVLRRIYFQRRYHRTSAWNRFLSIIAADLPHAWLVFYDKTRDGVTTDIDDIMVRVGIDDIMMRVGGELTNRAEKLTPAGETNNE